MIQLYNGDCLEIMRKIPDKSIDLILCDLPYGTTKCSWDIIIPFEKLWRHYKCVSTMGFNTVKIAIRGIFDGVIKWENTPN